MFHQSLDDVKQIPPSSLERLQDFSLHTSAQLNTYSPFWILILRNLYELYVCPLFKIKLYVK